MMCSGFETHFASYICAIFERPPGYDSASLYTKSPWRGECPGDQRSMKRFNEPGSIYFVGYIAYQVVHMLS